MNIKNDTGKKPSQFITKQETIKYIKKKPNSMGCKKQLTIAIKGDEWLKRKNEKVNRILHQINGTKLESCTFTPIVHTKLDKRIYNKNQKDIMQVKKFDGTNPNSYSKLSKFREKPKKRIHLI